MNQNTPQRKMTLKQQLFVESYVGISAGNATDAARRAGDKGNDKTLCVVGIENLAKPSIAEAIASRVSEVKKALHADDVLEELSVIARSPWSLFSTARLDDDGKVVDVKIRLSEKIRALELLGRYHKLFVERHEHTDPDGGPIKHQHGLDDDATKLLAKLLGVHPAQLPSKEVDRAES